MKNPAVGALAVALVCSMASTAYYARVAWLWKDAAYEVARRCLPPTPTVGDVRHTGHSTDSAILPPSGNLTVPIDAATDLCTCADPRAPVECRTSVPFDGKLRVSGMPGDLVSWYCIGDGP